MGVITSVSTQILDELITTVESIGVEKTVQSLKEARTKSLILSDINVENIIKIVEDATGVKKERILHGNDRTDERKISISLCIYYIKKEYGYSYAELKKIFNKDEAALYRYFQIVDLLPTKPKSDFDKKLSSLIKEINPLITREKIK
jgi:chromosomal replication initiation ATPase DnaA